MTVRVVAPRRPVLSDARRVGPQVVRVLRHQRLVGVADEERRGAAEDDHRRDARIRARLAEDVPGFGQPEARPSRRLAAPAVAGVGHADEEDRQRKVDQHVGQDAPRRSQPQHEPATHGRAEQDREVPAAGVEPDRAVELLGADHVVQDELDRRDADDAGRAVDEEEDDGVPDAKRIGEEEDTPRD